MSIVFKLIAEGVENQFHVVACPKIQWSHNKQINTLNYLVSKLW
jgi:hypothetical protein